MDKDTIEKILTRYKRDMEVTESVATLEMALEECLEGMTKEERMRLFLELESWCKVMIVNEMMEKNIK